MTVPEQTRHLGDGVYATFDGYGFEIRTNDHRNPIAVYLDPSVLKALVQFQQEHREREALRRQVGGSR